MKRLRDTEYGSFKMRLVQCLVVFVLLFLIYGYNASKGYVEPCELHDLGNDPSVELSISGVD